jgi:acyl-coenzyme A synthetase/AMP-(fatty) acid ligase
MSEVLDTAVVGRPCEIAGELPVAFVVKKPGADITEDSVIKFVAGSWRTTGSFRGKETWC